MVKVALLIGVSEYEHGLTPLPKAVCDVEAMREVLVNPEIGGFAEEDVKVLKNPQGQEMADEIYHLYDNRQKDDLVLLYFSGHGVTDESGDFYFSTRQTRINQNRLLPTTAVGATSVHGWMNRSRSKRLIVILDCCFSGAFAKGLTAKDTGNIDLQKHLGGEGRAILTATTSTQYAFAEDSLDLSIYTHYLVEGMTSGAADKDGDGLISIDELHQYAKSKVQEASPAMTPEFYPHREGFRIVIAQSAISNPRVQYRREVERRIDHGQFSIPARCLLNSLRLQLQLDSHVADAIELEVQQPYREYQRKLKEYEETLENTIKVEPKLTKKTRQDLEDYQQHLLLRDEDVEEIKKRIISPDHNKQDETQPTDEDNKPDENDKTKTVLKCILLVIIGAVIGYMIRHMNTNTVISVTPPKPNPLDQVDDSLPNPAVLTIDGTVTIITLIEELRNGYNIVNPNVRTTYGLPDGKPNGSNAGLGNLLSEKVLMAASSRGLNVVEVPIALDAVAVTVGINNPYEGGLTKEQLRSIFLGKITNWSQVGGPNLPIKVINRSPDSGTHSFFKEVVLDGQSFPPDGPNFNTVTRDETIPILRALGNNGIGYSSVTQIENQSSVRVVPIDGISPIDRNNIKNGTYPLSRSVYLVVPRKTSQAVKKFVEFALSPKGQAAVEREGFIPIQ